MATVKTQLKGPSAIVTFKPIQRSTYSTRLTCFLGSARFFQNPQWSGVKRGLRSANEKS